MLARIPSYLVYTFASVAIAVGGLWSFFIERWIGGIDQLGLFNPIYMVWKYGIISYPSYGYFQTMIVHPPTNYILMGELMRIGFAAPYAEAVGPFILIV